MLLVNKKKRLTDRDQGYCLKLLKEMGFCNPFILAINNCFIITYKWIEPQKSNVFSALERVSFPFVMVSLICQERL